MATRALIAFEHNSKMGNASAHELFDRVTVNRSNPESGAARKFGDYVINVKADNLPTGVSIKRLV